MRRGDDDDDDDDDDDSAYSSDIDSGSGSDGPKVPKGHVFYADFRI